MMKVITLLLRKFSSSNAKNLMQASGQWWYDVQSVGNSTNLMNQIKVSAFSALMADVLKGIQSSDEN